MTHISTVHRARYSLLVAILDAQLTELTGVAQLLAALSLVRYSPGKEIRPIGALLLKLEGELLNFNFSPGPFELEVR